MNMECMCRVCETIYGLRNMFEEENEELLLMLRSVANITITADDLLPKYLCNLCSHRLQKSYDFKLQCELTDQKLRDTIEPDKDHFLDTELETSQVNENTMEEMLYRRLYEKVVGGNATEESTFEDYATFDYIIAEEKGDVQKAENTAAQESPTIEANIAAVTSTTAEAAKQILNENAVVYVDNSKVEEIGSKFDVVEENAQFEDIIEEDYSEEMPVAEHIEPKKEEASEVPVVVPEPNDEQPHPSSESCVTEVEKMVLDPAPKETKPVVAKPPAKVKARKEPKVYSCGMCTETFDSSSKLNNHKRKHARYRFQCTVCNKSFGRSNGLRDHLLVHIGKKVSCHLCDRQCSNRGNLMRHIQQCHHKLKPYKCDHCSVKYSRKASLLAHIAAYHEETREHPCDICGRVFRTTFYLATHRRRHLPQPPRPPYHQAKRKEKISYCPQCGKKSRSLPTHIAHMRIHSEVKAYACQECPKRFHFKQSLLTHMMCHTGERPYKCEACGKSFRQVAHLRTHTKTVHMGAREFQCQYCRKFFTSSGTLKIHERLHTGEKPYACDICPSKFIDSKGLKKHKASAHSNDRFEATENSEEQGGDDDTNQENEDEDDSQMNELRAIPEEQVLDEGHFTIDQSNIYFDISNEYAEVEADDLLPKYICAICDQKLRQVHDFIKKCEETDQKLRKSYQLDQRHHRTRTQDGVPKKHNQREKRDVFANVKNSNKIPADSDDSYYEVNQLKRRASNDEDCIDFIYQSNENVEDIKSEEESSVGEKEFDNIDDDAEFLEEIQYTYSPVVASNSGIADQMGRPDNSVPQTHVFNVDEELFEDFIIEDAEQSENYGNQEDDNPKPVCPTVSKAPKQFKRSRTFKCNSCTETFTNFNELNAHKKSHGEKRFECPTCSKLFSRHYRLREHLLIHTNPRQLPCLLCSNTYTNHGNLDRHIRHCHNKEKPHSCETCGMRFARKATLQVHVAIHSDARNFECDKCGKRFKTEYYLNVHRKSHIPVELRLGKRPTQKRKAQICICHYCGKTSNTLSLHINHMRTHSVEKPFECPTCQKRFNFKQALKTHMLLHSGEKPFSCDVCSMAFRQVGHLKGHKIAVHAGLKQHKCQYCDKSFALRSNLTIHERLHTGNKPHQCPICGKRFNDTNGLKRHKIAHARNGQVEAPCAEKLVKDEAASVKVEDSCDLNQLDVSLDQLNVYLDELGNEYTEIIEAETALETTM